MQAVSKALAILLIALLLFSLVMMADYVVANGDEDEYEEDEGEAEGGEEVEGREAEGGEFAEASGVIAFYGALLFNAIYVPVNRLRRNAAIRVPGPLLLNIHIAVNLILAAFAFWHALNLSEAAGPVEYVSVALILYLLVSGFVMRFPARNKVKTLARLMHAQLIVSLILVVVLFIHVGVVSD